MAVRLRGTKSINRIVSHLPGVGASVHRHAEQIGKKATFYRMQHYAEGEAEIRVEKGRVDSYVSLVDAAALSIEFGHINARTGKYVPGLYIVSRAAGLA